jgi:DNA-binding XRE family transcriptional regulator
MRAPPDPSQIQQPQSIEQIRARLCEAMGIAVEEIYWFEEATRRLEAHRGLEEKLKVYDISTPGKRLRTAREIAGWTQHQLAARTHLKGIQVSNYETGNTHCPAETFSRLCRTLRVSEAWVLGDSEEGGPPCPKSGVMRRQFIPNWTRWSHMEKAKVMAKAELDRLRGLRPQKCPKPAPDSPQE